MSRNKARLDSRGAKAVVARQRRRRGAFRIGDEVVEAHQFALAVLDREHRDVFGCAAVLVTHRTDDVVLASLTVFSIT